MINKQLLVAILATSLCLGLAGTVFAGATSTYDGSEAGDWEFRSPAPDSKASIAAKNYHYDSEKLANVGTEAGNWKFEFDAASTKASLAAQNYQYDQSKLAAQGTEAGNWEFDSNSSGANPKGVIADKTDLSATSCKNC